MVFIIIIVVHFVKKILNILKMDIFVSIYYIIIVLHVKNLIKILIFLKIIIHHCFYVNVIHFLISMVLKKYIMYFKLLFRIHLMIILWVILIKTLIIEI